MKRLLLILSFLILSVSFVHAQNLTQLCVSTTGTNCDPEGATLVKVLTTASTNSNLIRTGNRLLYDVYAFNTNAATAYLKFYNKATAPTCNSDTVVATIPLPQNISISLFPSYFGRKFSLGIGICVTGGLADNDNTNATTGAVVNVSYK